MNQTERFVSERDAAIKSFDPEKFRQFAFKYTTLGFYGAPVIKDLCSRSDDFVKYLMAKMCLEITTMPKATKERAKAIIREWKSRKENNNDYCRSLL